MSEKKLDKKPKKVKLKENENENEKEKKTKEKIEKGKERIEQLFTEAYKKSNRTLRLSDDIFDISIGKRVIADDLGDNSAIPVYSANVFEPFGYVESYLIEDFSVPSVLWGIDGDWMVNYIPAGKPFYPTDHCGVLRLKTNDILPKYFAWVLEKVGVEQRFSRTLRASIDRIKGLSIKIPPLPEQQRIVSDIEKIENHIQEMQNELDQLSDQKILILKKYL